jgi:hypothetical protein
MKNLGKTIKFLLILACKTDVMTQARYLVEIQIKGETQHGKY